MDAAEVTVKEAWVKAKVVCGKKGVQMVSSLALPPPTPPPPPHFPTLSPIFPHSALATETDKGVASLVNLRSGQFWLTRSAACFLLTGLMKQHESMSKGILNRWVRGYHKMLLMPIKCCDLQDPNPIGVLN